MSEGIFFEAIKLVVGTVAFLASLRFVMRYLELRHERRLPLANDALQERLGRIEAAVEATAVEMERISEAHRFMAKLLSDRVGPTSLTGRPERVITPH